MSIPDLKTAYEAEADRLRGEYRAALKRALKDARRDLDAAVVAHYCAGTSIAALCRLWGTSTRRTIIDILNEAGVYDKGVFNGDR